MMGFLKSLLGLSDRTEVASARAAAAVEGIASDLEEIRQRLRAHFGLTAPEELSALPAPDAPTGRRKTKNSE